MSESGFQAIVTANNARGMLLLRSRALLLLLASVFIVSMGYGVVLPVLPGLLESIPEIAQNVSIPWHTGLLTSTYMAAIFLFAPMWGALSDRVGRRKVILLGLAGFSIAMLLFGLSRRLILFYLSLALAGVFAAAVLPIVLAWVSEVDEPEKRARAFARLSASSALGFFFGPALGGWLASIDTLSPATAGAIPFLTISSLGGLISLLVYNSLPEDVHSKEVSGVSAPARLHVVKKLLMLSWLAMFGIGSFEVGLALQGQGLINLRPRELGWLFAECSLVMILMQLLVMTPMLKRYGSKLLVPGFFVMALGIAILPLTTSYIVLFLGVGLIAGSAGLLIPALAYFTSVAAGSHQGAILGKQTAATSLGQALGSALAGWLFAMVSANSLWVPATLIAIGALEAIRLAKIFDEVPA